jgi:hypothetical protein
LQKLVEHSKEISGIKGSDMSIPPILHNDNLIFDDIKRANLFNIYFSKQSKIDDSNSNIPNLSHVTNQISEIKLCENEVEDVLKVIIPTKAPGPDLINPRLLKEASPIIKHPFCTLFNLSLRVASYPSQWKRANITPVFKNNKQNDVTNYRPISLLNVISKCMERCVYKHIHNHLLDNDILTTCTCQSGFTKGDSAVDQLINITNNFGKALDSGKEVWVVFCDISKAFDRVWHKGLIHKLKQSGISGNLLKWFQNYLYGREQRVVINGSNSNWLPIRAGVPQGFILGPFLFIFFTNDIVNEINAEIKLFADDTSLYLIVDNPRDTVFLRLNQDHNQIQRWSEKWLVKFNPNKTETGYFQ